MSKKEAKKEYPFKTDAKVFGYMGADYIVAQTHIGEIEIICLFEEEEDERTVVTRILIPKELVEHIAKAMIELKEGFKPKWK